VLKKSSIPSNEGSPPTFSLESFSCLLLFEVTATDVGVLALPTATIFAVALLAAVPAIVRAVRIDPATALRLE
jgi:hypothetical protein